MRHPFSRLFFEQGALVPVFDEFVRDRRRRRGHRGVQNAGNKSPPAPPREVEPTASEAPPAPQKFIPPTQTTPGSLSPRARGFAEERGFSMQPEFPWIGLREDGYWSLMSQEGLSLLTAALFHREKNVATGLSAPADGSGVRGMILSSDLTEPSVKIF